MRDKLVEKKGSGIPHSCFPELSEKFLIKPELYQNKEMHLSNICESKFSPEGQ